MSRPTILAWSLDLSDPRWDVSAEAACLTDAELSRAARGTSSVRRRRVLVRAGLRRVLGGLLGLSPGDVPVGTDRGRPVLPGNELVLSCSASEDLALIAVADRGALGVDVERHRDGGTSALEEGWLADEELVRLRALPGHARGVAITRAWTQKEAVLKARGTGLVRLPVDTVTPVSDGGPVAELHVSRIPVPPGYVASAATGTPVGPDLPAPVTLVPGGRE
ncbi:4'-phosphopantetheinyl transferase family protein [Modestobacter altitudinis]|uniref:4'-phosphopantetheinyl transferase family protein n=1 Tax=Modestobacter altitudinis TaxID=2213158 RepID=UPI001487339F|nr:4'-phosphopantetheinyl transferase superfamily protein [Modestobacter altitudinis]